MSAQWPPIKGSAFSFYVALRSQADSTTFISNATLIPGDVKVSGDGAANSNISVLPVVTPAGAFKQILVSVMTTDSSYDNIGIIFSDQTGAQWMDLYVPIQTVAASWGTFNVSTDSVKLMPQDYSSVVTVGAGIATPSKVTVQIQAGVYSTVSLRLDANAIPSGAFQANSIDNIAVKAGAYSGVSVDVRNIAPGDYTSALTVGVGSIAKASYSGVTVGIDNIKGASYSGVTLQGLSSIQSADLQQIMGSGPAAIRLGSHLSSVVTGKVIAGVSQTTSFTADVSCTTNDNYNGRVLVFTDPGTSGLYGQATSINSASGFVGFSNGSSLFNVQALTNAPPANSTFLII